MVGVVIVAFVGLLASADAAPDDDPSALVGTRMPRIEGETIQGDQFDSDEYLQSWLIVNFFAEWCPGCIREHPDLLELDAWAKQRGDVQLVAVVFNDSDEDVVEFFAREGGDWPVLNEPTIPFDYRISQIPETFIVSPSGQVVWHIPGEVRAQEVVDFIQGDAP